MYPGSSLLSLPRLGSSRSCQRVARVTRVTRVLIRVSLVGDCPSWFFMVQWSYLSECIQGIPILSFPFMIH